MTKTPMKSDAPMGGLVLSPPRTIQQARRTLSKLIAALYRGEVDDLRARTMCYLLVSLVSIIRDSDFEQRIQALEKAQEKKK